MASGCFPSGQVGKYELIGKSKRESMVPGPGGIYPLVLKTEEGRALAMGALSRLWSMALTLSVQFHFGVNSAMAGASEADGGAELPTVGTAGLGLGKLGAGLSHPGLSRRQDGQLEPQCVRASNSDRRTSPGQSGSSSESRQCPWAVVRGHWTRPGRPGGGDRAGWAGGMAQWQPRQQQGLHALQGATAGVARPQGTAHTQRGPQPAFPRG